VRSRRASHLASTGHARHLRPTSLSQPGYKSRSRGTARAFPPSCDGLRPPPRQRVRREGSNSWTPRSANGAHSACRVCWRTSSSMCQQPSVICLLCMVLLCLDKCIAKPDRVQFISTDSREHASSVPPAPSNRQPEPSLIRGSGTDDVNGLPANEFCTFESQDCGLRPKNEAGPSLRGLGKPGRCNRSEFRLILASQKPAGYSIFDPSAMPGISAFPCAYYNSRLQYAFA